MKRKYLLSIIIAVFVFSLVRGSESTNEAKIVTKHFAESMARFDAVTIVEEMHPDIQAFFDKLAIHIYETTESESEKKEFLKILGVESPKELKSLPPKTMAMKFFQYSFSNYVAPEAKEASLKSKIKIVGSLVDGDLVYVLYKTQADFKDLSLSVDVPSVVTLKKYEGKYKVLSTTQFESMKRKLEVQNILK
jgi:hypothetical protein